MTGYTSENPAGRPTMGMTIGKIVGLFAIVGAGLGFGVMLVVWGTGVFDEDADLGATVFGSLTLMMGFAFSAFAGLLVAAIAGHYAAQALHDKNQSLTSAFIGSGAGHLVLFIVFAVIVVLGVIVLEGTGEKDSFGDEGGSGAASEEDAPAEGVPPWRSLAMLAGAAVPAALVGLVSANLLAPHARRPPLGTGPGMGPESIVATPETQLHQHTSSPPGHVGGPPGSPTSPEASGRSEQSDRQQPDQQSQRGQPSHKRCPRCSTVVMIDPEETPVCPNCGFS